MQAFLIGGVAVVGFCLCSCGTKPEHPEDISAQGKLIGKLVLPTGQGEYLRVRIENKSSQEVCLPKAYFSAASGDVRMWKNGKRVEQNLFVDGAANKIPTPFYVLHKNEIVDIPFSVEAFGGLRGEHRYEIKVGYEACSNVKGGLAYQKEDSFLISGSSTF